DQIVHREAAVSRNKHRYASDCDESYFLSRQVILIKKPALCGFFIILIEYIPSFYPPRLEYLDSPPAY
uniref:hypothetical protein n=1 Tax=Cronobacter dublinensis TaxID=413497 RepID=UPI001F473432